MIKVKLGVSWKWRREKFRAIHRCKEKSMFTFSFISALQRAHAVSWRRVLKRLRRKQTGKKWGRLRFGIRPDLRKQSAIPLLTILKTMSTPQWAHHLLGRKAAVCLEVWLVRHNDSLLSLKSNAVCTFKSVQCYLITPFSCSFSVPR